MTKRDRIGGGLSEEEMDELIASHDWATYRLEMKECRGGRHERCEGWRQPTNHIDPNATECICDCHPWNEEELEWDDEDEIDWEEDEDVEWVTFPSNEEEELAWEDVLAED